ncbi:hypothetical protein FRC08_018029 [Ceratobasidium sp. 394]|nr:hypothetical protein FRC08_018029 [Ceratobasidium sp. 394]KAG9089080.1 hypothetical protein FS749_001638 [Ceratobasidium sp. UAMH 11750]
MPTSQAIATRMLLEQRADPVALPSSALTATSHPPLLLHHTRLFPPSVGINSGAFSLSPSALRILSTPPSTPPLALALPCPPVASRFPAAYSRHCPLALVLALARGVAPPRCAHTVSFAQPARHLSPTVIPPWWHLVPHCHYVAPSPPLARNVALFRVCTACFHPAYLACSSSAKELVLTLTLPNGAPVLVCRHTTALARTGLRFV